MNAKHVCGKIRGPGNLIKRSTDDFQIGHWGSGMQNELTHSTHSIPPESAERLRSARDMGKEFNHHGSEHNARKPVHATTIVPHDGQQSSMMNEKHVQKQPGVDHPFFFLFFFFSAPF